MKGVKRIAEALSRGMKGFSNTSVKAQMGLGLPPWAAALVGVLVAVLFISLFYGVIVWTGGILANTINTTPGGSTPIAGTTPYQAFINLFQYVFTVGSFAGIAIVLAVVAVVFIVFYFLLGGSGQQGGATR
jgi:Fe2+ transport system protein B